MTDDWGEYVDFWWYDGKKLVIITLNGKKHNPGNFAK